MVNGEATCSPTAAALASELRAYIEGVDPLSGRPFAREPIEELSQPLNGRRGRAADAPHSSL
jgi:hypothetical protein